MAPDPNSEPLYTGAAPPREALVEREKCDLNTRCAVDFMCPIFTTNRCVRVVTVAELISWQKELEGITVVIGRTRLFPIDWVCTASHECVGQLALSDQNGRNGPVKRYMKLLGKNGAPYECKQTRGRTRCVLDPSYFWQIVGHFEAQRGAFVAEGMSTSL